MPQTLNKPPDLDAHGKPIISSNHGHISDKPPDLDGSGNPIAYNPELDQSLQTADRSVGHFLSDTKDFLTGSGSYLDKVKDTEPEIPDDRSLLRRAYDWGSTPLWEGPAKLGQYVSNKIDPDRGSTGLRSAASAFAESFGAGIGSLTSPINVALAGIGKVARLGATLANEAIPGLETVSEAILGARRAGNTKEAARLVDELASLRETAGRAHAYGTIAKNVERGANLGFIGEGAHRAYEGDWAQGIPEVALGALGMHSAPHIRDIDMNVHDVDKMVGHPVGYPNKPNIDLNPFNKETVNPDTGEITTTPPVTDNPPVFNPRGETGMTGTLQNRIPEFESNKGNLSAVGDRITLKKPTLDNIQELTRNGFETTGVNELGHITFERRTPETDPSFTEIDDAQGMRIPNTAKNGGLDNIAMGGASPRVLDVLGSSLYSNDRPTVIAKELLQNSFDEHRIAGQTHPIRVAFDHDEGSFTIRDYGRGMTPEQLYTKFTDLGETGKANEEGASGGFGFAKAAPMLGGEHVAVESVVDEGNKRFKYSFEGTPTQLKNQTDGVKLVKTEVTKDIPTGFKVKTKFNKDTSFYDAKEFIQRMTENSPSVTSQVETAHGYHRDETKHLNTWFDAKPVKDTYFHENVKKHAKKDLPELREELTIPGAKIRMHYKDATGNETSSYTLNALNKGLFQTADWGGYGSEIPNVPSEIYADVHALVEEGHADYPFTANREQLNRKTQAAINDWINENIVKGAQKNRIKALQKMYDDIRVLDENGPHDIHILDSDGLITPELHELLKHPVIEEGLIKLQLAHEEILVIANKMGWMPDNGVVNKLQKFGLLFQVPDKKGVTLGIHIPSPEGAGKKSAILVNLAAHLEKAAKSPNPADHMAAALFTTIAHEQAHIPGGGHDTAFAYRDAALREALGRRNTNAVMDALGSAFGDLESGQLNPEIQNFLSKYLERQQTTTRKDNALLATGIGEERPADSKTGKGINPESTVRNGEAVKSAQPTIHLKQPTVENIKEAIKAGYKFSGEIRSDGAFKMVKSDKPMRAPILETEVGSTRPTASNARAQLGPSLHNTEQSNLAAAMNFPRTVMASMDMSAPLRQGLPLIHKKEFWTSLDDMVKAFGSQKMFEDIQASIAEKPLFKQREVTLNNGKKKIMPSFAQDAGLKLTDIHGLDLKEENFMSKFAQHIPGVKRSERAYVAFLNKLRADTFEKLIENAGVLGAKGEANLPLARSIADFVNTATGRGSLGSLEKSATTLNTVFFAPRLIASRVKLLNVLSPQHYIYADPFIRKEALKSLFAMTSFGLGLGQLAKMGGASVETNPNNSDFGKIKIGNTRIDPWAGFQQYVVTANRLLRPSWAKVPGMDKVNTGLLPVDMTAGFLGHGGQQTSSSTSGKTFDLWNPKTPFQPTHKSIAERFAVGKANPIFGFAYAMYNGRKEMSGEKMNFTTPNLMENSIAQRFMPIIMQDVYQLSKTNPSLLPIVLPAAFLGMGSQTYGSQ